MTIKGQALTYADWAKRTDPDGKVAVVVEMLSQTNEVMDDMLVMEANQATGHKTTVRTGLPTATWRMLNYGVPKGKSKTAQIVDNIGMLETYSEIDKKLADLNGNTAEFRASEDGPFMEGMNQQMASALFYSNSAGTPEQIMGLAPRFNTVNPANAASAQNVIDCGGTASTNTSIWLVCWGANTVHGLFPKGEPTGLQHRDLGEHTLLDPNGNGYQGYRTHYKWDLGLTVRDWRYVVRICNIDVVQLIAGNAPNLINAMVRAVHRLPTQPRAAGPVQSSDAKNGMPQYRAAFYCNRTISTYIDLQALNKSNVLLKQEQWDGRPVLTFRGIPIRTCDALLSTEARVV